MVSANKMEICLSIGCSIKMSHSVSAIVRCGSKRSQLCQGQGGQHRAYVLMGVVRDHVAITLPSGLLGSGLSCLLGQGFSPWTLNVRLPHF